MDWIHCNSCFSQPSEYNSAAPKRKLFYLTSCGHIFCEVCGCFADGSSDCCKHCKNKCSFTLIGEKSLRTNPQVLEYFHEPEEIFEKLLNVMKFQKAHRIKLVGHHHRVLLKYNRAKIYIKKLENELKIVKNVLSNTPKSSYCDAETQSGISMPIFQPNSTPFKMIDAVSKVRNVPSLKKNISDTKYRKQSLQNELSVLSSGSMGTGVPITGSSVYISPLQNNSDEGCTTKLDNLQLNSFRYIRQFKRKHTT